MYYNRITELMPKKTLDNYIPPNLSLSKKNEMAKVLLDRRKGIKQITTAPTPVRQSIFTTRFNKRYGGLKDKSIKNLARYFKIQPFVLNTIYKKGAGAYMSSGSRPNVSLEQWARARLYKGILNIIKARETGVLPSSEAHDKSLVEKAVNFNKYIAPSIN